MKKTNTVKNILRSCLIASFCIGLANTIQAQDEDKLLFNHTFSCGSLGNSSENAALYDVTRSNVVLGRLINTGNLSPTMDRNNIASAAMQLDGLSLKNNIATTKQNSGELTRHTLSLWVKVDTSNMSTNKSMLCKFAAPGVGFGELGFRIYLYKSGQDLVLEGYGATYGNGGHRGSASPRFKVNQMKDNQWHHVVMTGNQNGTTMDYAFVVDNDFAGKLEFSADNNTGLWYYLAKGEFTINPSADFKGAIDDVMFYEYVLNQTEIDSLNNLNYGAPKRIYVNASATGNNDGTSWTDAFTDLREATVVARCNDEIWAAKGIYTHPSGDRNRIFGWLHDSIKLYGGFNGTEDQIFKRDITNNPTILSGEVQKDNDKTNNSFTVLVGPIGSIRNIINYSKIDGIIVEDGNATGGNYDVNNAGAGLFIYDNVRSLDILNSTFRNNHARNGGGALFCKTYTNNIDLKIENCTFTGNSTNGYGAAIDLRRTAPYKLNAQIRNCLITKNKVKYLNGNYKGNEGVLHFNAVYGTPMNIELTNNTIANNENTGTGTAKPSTIALRLNNSDDILKLTNNIIWNNQDSFCVTSVSLLRSQYRNNIWENPSEKPRFGLDSNNRIIDPIFADTANGDFSLTSSSPAIDAGLSTGFVILSTDLNGDKRIQGQGVDLGCYEFGGQASSIGDWDRKEKVIIYPNPSSTKIQVITSFQNAQFRILNLQGQEVLNGSTNETINISNLSSGVFIVQVINGQNISSTKFIKN